MATIASRLERATLSALLARPSSSSASSVIHCSANNDHEDGPPPLGTHEAVGCSQCGADLLRGSCSFLCLACGALHNHSPLPTMRSFFFSSLAYRRLLEAMQIDDLEPNPQAVGVESSATAVFDGTARTTLLPFAPLTGVKSTSNSIKTDQLSSSLDISESATVLQNAEQILSKARSLDFSSSTFMSCQENTVQFSESLDPEGSCNIAAYLEGMRSTDVKERSQIKNDVLDYSPQLPGVSLEDFFSRQFESRDTVLLYPVLTSKKSSEIHKDSFFWDPLTETVISNADGVNEAGLLADGSHSSTNGGEQQGTSKDDPFLSWEGDFQSAVPATKHSGAGSLIGFELIAEESHAGNTLESFRDPFAVHSFFATDSGNNPGPVSTSRGEENLMSSQLLLDGHSEAQQGGDQQPGTIFSNHMWLQSTATPATDIAKVMMEHELSLTDRRVETNSKMSVENHQQKALEDELLGFLVAQLHDLSFMLADKLVIKMDATPDNHQCLE